MKLTPGLLFLTACWACAAPAPAPRARKPQPLRLAGVWTLHWGEARYRMELQPGAHYRCTGEFGGVWIGCWSVSGRVLTVRESQGGSDWSDWSVELDERLEERNGWTVVRLERVKHD